MMFAYHVLWPSMLCALRIIAQRENRFLTAHQHKKKPFSAIRSKKNIANHCTVVSDATTNLAKIVVAERVCDSKQFDTFINIILLKHVMFLTARNDRIRKSSILVCCWRVHWKEGGLVVGHRTCDLVVAGSRPGRDAAHQAV